MEDRFDAVIVGSGFGGSVMAYRLAEAGLDVCVLERGRAYPPGSFPRSPRAMRRNLWDPEEGLYGLYSVHSFRNLDTVTASGLGGGSLVYSNVLIRKDERWFVREDLDGDGYEPWPVSRSDLEPHYDRVEEGLNAERYPSEHPPYSDTPKTEALREAGRKLDLEFHRPKLAVTFSDGEEDPAPGQTIHEEHENLHDRGRVTCQLCGECNIGCNYGSKNTLDYNYLTEAERHGADLRTLHEVRTITPRDGGGYRVGYREHRPEEGDASDGSVTADRVVLAAGTLGSTALLLKNRNHLPGLSDRLGTGLSPNGDLFGFALNSRRGEDDPRPRTLDPNFGPIITGALRKPDGLDGGSGRGFYLEDAALPAYLSWVVESLNPLEGLKRAARFATAAVSARLTGRTDVGAHFRHLMGDRLSSSSMPLLGMGRDAADGRLYLGSGGTLKAEWSMEASRDLFEDMKETMRAIAEVWNADFRMAPSWHLDRIGTVHPLGGCPMGRGEEEGVVDAGGEVFNHPGLYVADGSVMPGAVGPNPALTIAALSDRFADGIIREAASPGN